MKRASTIALSLALAPVIMAQNPLSQRTGQVTLKDLRDTSRPLLIFAPKPDDPQLEIQLRTLAENAPGVAERDITAVALPFNNPSPTPATMSATEADAARRRFNIAPTDFAVILIGKDGGEKLRSAKPIPYSRLQDTVDAMPMRREEMQKAVPGNSPPQR